MISNFFEKWLLMHFKSKNERHTQYETYESGCRWCLCDFFTIRINDIYMPNKMQEQILQRKAWKE